MLPAFFYEPEHIKRVLVLGVGGGSVIQLLHKHVQPDEIVGIELNPVHLTIAKRFFGINKKIAKLIAADAISWMEKYQGPPFDMIIDDLFGEIDLIVANTVDSKILKESAYFTSKQVANKFKSAYKLTIPQLENIVAVFLKQHTTSLQLRKNLMQTSGLNHRSGPNKLNVSIREITRQ